MIKLIATDIDGTLVKDSSPNIYPEMIEVIKKLTKRGIVFTVASGRSYASIRAMFHEVKDDIAYISENGALVVLGGNVLSVTKMNDYYVKQILEDFRSYKPEYEYVISTPEGSLLETENENFIALIRDEYHNKYKVVKDALEQNTDIIKLSLYKEGSIRALGDEVLIPKWSSNVKVCMAGDEWLDFMDISVDKGNALSLLQRHLNISREETMSFGDNSNDIGLMQQAQESYAVENAIDEVKQNAKHICPSYTEKGVYQILNKL